MEEEINEVKYSTGKHPNSLKNLNNETHKKGVLTKAIRLGKVKEAAREQALLKEGKYPRGKHPNTLKNLKKHAGKHLENLRPNYEGKNLYTEENIKTYASLKTLREYFSVILTFPAMVKMPDGTEEEKTIMDAVAMKLVAMALKGNLKAVEIVLDRNFGKEEQRIIMQMTHEQALLQLKKKESEIIEGEIIEEIQKEEINVN